MTITKSDSSYNSKKMILAEDEIDSKLISNDDDVNSDDEESDDVVPMKNGPLSVGSGITKQPTVTTTINMMDNNDTNNNTTTTATTTVVLFYKYFLPTATVAVNQHNHTAKNSTNNYFYLQHPDYSNYYLTRLQDYIQNTICNTNRHTIKGRILLATEGINGTVSADDPSHIQQFIAAMESLDIIQQFGIPTSSTVSSSSSTLNEHENDKRSQNEQQHYEESTAAAPPQEEEEENKLPTEFLFRNIDWKVSSTKNRNDNTTTTNNNNNTAVRSCHPFPDLKISIVNEIISTGSGNSNSSTNNSNSSSGGITLQDMVEYGGGIHLSPTEFHTTITNEGDNVLLFDIRNTFEYQIGHFVNPNKSNMRSSTGSSTSNSPFDGSSSTGTQQQEEGTAAIHPKDMVHFSNLPSILEQTIFNNNENETTSTQKEMLQNKKILLYCTGGIRCEKASVMFQKYFAAANHNETETNRNSSNTSNTTVYQLSGGIHRYIEQYGSSGYFKGKNFVFDQRIVQDPSDYDDHNSNRDESDSTVPATTTVDVDDKDRNINSKDDGNIVGRCIECQTKYDALCGSRICTVCRDLVLVCPNCQSQYREYHCLRHHMWKSCYYTFLEIYTIPDLKKQYKELCQLREGYLTPKQQRGKLTQNKDQQCASKKTKNVRHTLYKQIGKVQDRIHDLENGIAQCNRNATRRCRTCYESNTLCDGKCWGFWKQSTVSSSSSSFVDGMEPMLPIATIGTLVEPGPNWNEMRFGSKFETTMENISLTKQKKRESKNPQPEQTQPERPFRRGRVVDIKTWGSNSIEYDCVAVSWLVSCLDNEGNTTSTTTNAAPLIYRWGVIARNGQRMYDVHCVRSREDMTEKIGNRKCV